ncbi:esterase 6-like [Aethina tumida]|uniref:esterase 6-like n=1 Tax=Aethina tumida TaxID=116153 RepID=UPI0021478524|nr:esterase 6-like [Aethina tumida]
MGAFGFLSTSDTVIPGNNGLRDQQLALKWVQDNIELFGGNPQKVTIMGQSAGAAAVTYQMLNQNSDGLYRAAIGQSGSFLNTWAYTSSTKDTAFELGRELNFTGNTSEDLKKFLKIQSAVDIKIAATHVYSNNAVKGFLPSIEIDHVDAFVTQPMYEQLVEGRINKNIPVIMGTTSEEMIAKLIGGIDVFKTTLKDYDDDLSGLVYRNMHLNDSKVKTIVGREIRSIYTNGTFENHIQEGVKYFTDSYFSKAVMRFAELYSKYSDVYFYKFSYSGPLGHNPSPKLPGIGKVMHSEDNYYLWVTNGDDADIFNYSERDIATSNKYVDMFTYFTKNLIPWEAGNKNLSWPKLSCESFTFLDIDEILTVKENPRGPAYKKWVELYEKWAVKPLDSF